MNGNEQGLGAGVSSAWNERVRLIRLRRRKEHSRFRDELKLIPRWLVVTVIALFLIAEATALLINLSGVGNNGHPWPDDVNAVVASLAMALVVALVSCFIVPWILLIGYVNRDAKRRGMNSTLWTLLCVILMPAYLALGFIIYFLVREPLPYACPKCAATVGPRFNFCPSCKCDLHPSCPQCRREIVETDRFCPNCGCELGAAAGTEPAVRNF
jgi:hypothetical protein